ncbi:MAG TPA: PASTA domain-containing protein [Salinimicrobium sp.]|nr:PASTA domain-containing protein [Salinimicrobium sp.]
MGFIKFIFSRAFLIQLALAIVVLVVISFLFLQWLDYSTNQDQRIAVPKLKGLSLDVAENKLEELDLQLEVLDSANFDPKYPPHSVLEQVPAAENFVKEDRKIYLTLNPSGYRKIEIPENLIRKTRRQVEPTLKSLGFEIGEITYKQDLAKDAVLELKHKGKVLKPGDKLRETSVIDLVLGDGTGSYQSTESDSTNSVGEIEISSDENELEGGE